MRCRVSCPGDRRRRPGSRRATDATFVRTAPARRSPSALIISTASDPDTAKPLTPEQKATLAGIERADSITIDAHKWLAATMGTGMFLVRDATLAPTLVVETLFDFVVATGLLATATLLLVWRRTAVVFSRDRQWVSALRA